MIGTTITTIFKALRKWHEVGVMRSVHPSGRPAGGVSLDGDVHDRVLYISDLCMLVP